MLLTCIYLLSLVTIYSGSVELITLELQFENPFSDSYNLSTLKATFYVTILGKTILGKTLCPHQTWNNIFGHQNCRISI
jgi:hypothetical protein